MSMMVNSARFASAGGGGGVTSTQWRVLITATQGSGSWPNVAEVEMRANAGGVDQCVGGVASASHFSGGTPPANAFDDNTGTICQINSSGRPVWLQYTFLAAVNVQQLRWQRGGVTNDTPKDFEIQYWDGSTWVTYWSEVGIVWGGPNLIFTKP